MSQWFPPERVKMPLVIAQGLVGLGHEVDVLTGFPNYPEGRIIAPYRQQRTQREDWAPGITVHRTPLYPSHDGSLVHRSANYLSWAATASFASAMSLPRPDAFLVYSSPVTASLPTLAHRPSRRVPTALLLQDLWPDSVMGSGMADGWLGRPVSAGLGVASRALYRRADAIGTISRGMADVLTDRGVEPDRIQLNPNWVDTSHLQPDATKTPRQREALGLPSKGRVFMYAGNLGPLQNLEPLVRAFESADDAHLVLLGNGIARSQLQRIADDLKTDNVHLPGPCPPQDVGRWLAQADVLVLSLDDSPLLRVTMPSKVQTYLAAGRPVLAHASGDAAQVITEAAAGLVVQPGDVTGLRSAIAHFLQQGDSALLELGYRARRAYDDEFSEERGVQRLQSLLDRAVSVHAARRKGR